MANGWPDTFRIRPEALNVQEIEMSAPANLIEIPLTTKILPCGKCGRNLVVSTKTVLVYCPGCSQGLGEKR
jgi:hypothetical protein